MPIAKVTTDYTGRTKDISILQYPDATIVDAQQVSPAFGKISRYCTGAQKLIQRYAIILLTNIGSQPAFPDFGTDLISTLQSGISSVDTILATQIFNIANYSAVMTLQIYQTTKDDIPDDERISSATLTNISLLGGSAAFEITITTEAGSDIDFVVPLPK